jgi:hypothetical protein
LEVLPKQVLGRSLEHPLAHANPAQAMATPSSPRVSHTL